MKHSDLNIKPLAVLKRLVWGENIKKKKNLLIEVPPNSNFNTKS